jgi:hypothetical protein
VRYFDDLGKALREGYKKIHFDSRGFTDLALKTLTAFPPATHVEPQEVIRAVLEGRLPEGKPTSEDFGEPGLEVFRDEHFVIQALFWLDGTPSIHQHGFSGAFVVLEGSSIHIRYTFKAEQSFGPHFERGTLSYDSAELLKRGDLRPIHGGRDFIHSLFHLERPSVTVVTRTVRDSWAGPQFDYLPPALADDPFWSNEALKQRLRILRLLREGESALYAEAVEQLIGELDVHSAYRILAEFARHAPWPKTLSLIGRTQSKLGDLAPPILASLAETRRREHLIEKRRRVRNPEHRFALALLINAPSWEAVKALVHAYRPQTDPASQFFIWLSEMTTDSEEQLGVQLKPTDLEILRLRLEGCPTAQIVEELHTNPQVTRDLITSFELSYLFQRLLQPGRASP